MQVTPDTLSELAKRLLLERKRQGLTRAQAASVCGVSTSFIRDAEADPSRCTLALLLQLIEGLGLSLAVDGWKAANASLSTAPGIAPGEQEQVAPQ
jgi:HTH-type transcriptional regulator / antitoxin HipB